MSRLRAGRALHIVAMGLALSGFLAFGVAVSPARADRANMSALVRNCRADYRQFCRGTHPGGGAVLGCLKAHEASLSEACRTTLGGGASATASAKPEAADQVLRDIVYGANAKQTFDVYLPKNAHDAPILVMVHGGAWMVGDKSAGSVVTNKAAHWLARGYLFISVNNRLMPDASPLVQAQDVATALATIQRKAHEWGGDPDKLVLMGHSAGAHLVALVTAAPALAAQAGAKPWRATVALDSAALDIPAIMQRKHYKFYDRAFGSDPAVWRQASPLQQLTKAVEPILLVCSSKRSDSCPPAQTFAQAAIKLGGRAEVLPEALTHKEINANLGLPGAYTDAVDSFLASAGLP